MLVFGLDMGSTSIGFAVVDIDEAGAKGSILRMGSRIFPEARDSDGTPFNQQRRVKRMMRRQTRRRKERRRALNEALCGMGLLPPFSSPEWAKCMSADPYPLRSRALTEALTPYELGRSIYHLAKRRHFKGRDFDDDGANNAGEGADEKKAKTNRDNTLQTLKAEGKTLGSWLATKPAGERKRNIHATRDVVDDEFRQLWLTQSRYHPCLREPNFIGEIENIVFSQKPVFWRKSTLGKCRFEPGAELCPKASWLSQQRRMLEKLNNLSFAGGNARPLDPDERAAILGRLETQGSMSWGGVRDALKPLFKARDESVKSLKFNLEIGDNKGKLPGNALEAKLAAIFGADWVEHPHKQALREQVPARLWEADYGVIGTQRVVIRQESERRIRRKAARDSFIRDFDVTGAQADALAEIPLPSGWEPFSTSALAKMLPELERGVRFGALLASPEREPWRAQTFPDREQPTGEFHDRLPSPADKEEARRIAQLRNPTVVRSQNELRKIVNNLIGLYGKPDMIRVELARDVGKSKREREEIDIANRKQERRRKDARADLESKGIALPSEDDIEKWLLWKEGKERCPYTGDQICFDDLFRSGRYQVEHIWPRSKSLDNSFRNKTLCREDVNRAKSNKTPYEHFLSKPDEWNAITERLDGMLKAGEGLSPGKIKRFLRTEPLPDDFAARQLNDTGYAARLAVTFLQKLWPDVGNSGPVKVQAVSGRVTAQLRKRWGLNSILGVDGEKTRADHRHHAIDALVVACAHAGYVKRLSDYYADERRGLSPHLSEPWPTIRQDASTAAQCIVVSHRVRKKISGPLHKETIYGDTKCDETTKSVTYRIFVTRKPVQTLTKSELQDIRDPVVKEIVTAWVTENGGDPKKAFASFPRLGPNGPEIRKVRLTSKQQMKLMAPVTTGYADLGANHHIAIYRTPAGKADFEVVSRFEASRRLARREPIVRRKRDDAAEFQMSLSAGDTIQFAKAEGQMLTLWRVQKIASNGQISLLDIADASPLEPSLFEPTVGGLISRRARKVSVDPIGRVRPAND